MTRTGRMSRKLLFALYAAALLLALTTAYPLRHENRRDLSTFDQAISDRALGGLHFVEDDLERRASRKSRAAARKAKGITVNPKTGKLPGVALPKGVKGPAAKKHIDDARAAKHAAKNGPGPSIYANTKKGAKDARAKEQRKDAKEIHALKAKGRPHSGAKVIAKEKAEHKLHLANARTEYAKSLASGTFPHRDAKFTTPKGSKFFFHFTIAVSNPLPFFLYRHIYWQRCSPSSLHCPSIGTKTSRFQAEQRFSFENEGQTSKGIRKPITRTGACTNETTTRHQ